MKALDPATVELARGRVTRDAALGPMTWFRTGGAADILVRPASADQLARVLSVIPAEVPVMALGVGSNVIVRDGGVRGVVVRLMRGFTQIEAESDGIVAGAGALDAAVAEHAAAAGMSGLEFLVGIPGTIGGGVAMNAGCYGFEMADVLDWAECVTRDGQVVRLRAHELGLAYRESRLPGIVTQVRLFAAKGDAGKISARMVAIREERARTQPRAMTGGSTFRNPPEAKAWELIDRAGCRGLTLGGAMVSEKHCNFLVNTGTATSADIEALGELARARVLAESGVVLHWEVRLIGDVPCG